MLKIGQHTPWGQVGAIVYNHGERFYLMIKNDGKVPQIAMIPEITVLTHMAPSPSMSPQSA